MEVNYPGVIARGAIIPAPIVRGQFFWVSLFGGNYPGGQLSGGQLSWEAIVRGAIVQGAIIQGAIVRGTIVLEPSVPYSFVIFSIYLDQVIVRNKRSIIM